MSTRLSALASTVTVPGTPDVVVHYQEQGIDPEVYRDAAMLVSQVLDELDDADLDTLGYPRVRIAEQLEAAKGAPVPVKAQAPLRYRMERKALVALRRNVKDNALGRVLQRARFALDVLLRE